jgi:hypothetical protein
MAFKDYIENWKMATLWGAILWVFIFVEVSVFMFAPPFQGNEFLQRILHLLVLPFLVVLCAYMYFKNTKPSLKAGLYLGIWFIIISTILDLAITIPLFVKSFALFKEWSVWVGTAEVLAFSALTGKYKK